MARMAMVDQRLLRRQLGAMRATRTLLVESALTGDKNNGFDVLYHNMKHGQISSKELTDFIRERSTIEEAYARSMTKLAKSAGNFSPLGTFAPVWDVFKTSTEKLASCHMELVRKLQELIKEVQKYVEEQAKAHKKTKEEVASTLEAVQNIQTTSQALQKSKEIYNAKTVEQERLRKDGAAQRDVDKAGVKAKKATETYRSFVEKYAAAKSEFEQKMAETAQKFQDIEENHILHMKEIIQSYSRSVDETHIQIGEVHTEFVRNVENTSVDSLVLKLAESKGTGKERPGPIEFEECNTAIVTEGAKPRKRKPFGIPGRRKDKDTDSTESTEVEAANTANGAPPGYYGAIDLQNAVSTPTHTQAHYCDELGKARVPTPYELTNNDLLSLDPFGPTRAPGSASSLSSSAAEAVTQRERPPPLGAASQQSQDVSSLSSSTSSPRDCPDDPFRAPPPARARSAPITAHAGSPPRSGGGPPPWSQGQWIAFGDPSAPARRSGPPAGPGRSCRFLSAEDPCGGGGDPCFSEVFCGVSDRAMAAAPSSKAFNVPAPNRPTTPLTAGALVPPPRPSSRPKLPSGKLSGITEIVRPFSPPKPSNNPAPPPAAPLARAESSSSLSSNASLGAANTPTVEEDVFIGKLPTFEKRCETPAGTSRGPSPVTLASLDALPIAVAFTESVNAYFKGADPTKCIVKITGDMTLSFPMGIIKVFTTNPSPAVLAFKLKNTGRLEQILPNQQLLYSDPSQSDSNSKDFWFNMQALTSYLRKSSEQNPTASYYNVDILKYQVQSDGIHSTPLNLAVYWKCTASASDLRVDYRYNPESMAPPGPLSNVQILVPVDGGVTNMQSLPPSIWNPEQNKSLWKLSDISEKSENEGAGSLRAKFELSDGPSTPTPLAVQFMSEGSTLSGVDMELQGPGYRLSLNKKRFATGRYMADC
ncbi:LOW QUALITY PROTEIN: F-BAR domain only protein 2 [Pungitius pungitius]|uniref:LOW QUALITY PROTEIN: F-BAR domain only protein 2 n=1 Tax=Pungitius pungitius TaxID=134920 RepID=UPI002E11EA5F